MGGGTCQRKKKEKKIVKGGEPVVTLLKVRLWYSRPGIYGVAIQLTTRNNQSPWLVRCGNLRCQLSWTFTPSGPSGPALRLIPRLEGSTEPEQATTNDDRGGRVDMTFFRLLQHQPHSLATCLPRIHGAQP